MEVTKGIPVYDGKAVSTFPEFKGKFINCTSMVSSKMYQILMGDEPSTQTTGAGLVRWNQTNKQKL